MKYKITKARCQKMINGICRRCGGGLVPFKTVDNAGDPTYWAGCPKCSVFDWGCKPEIYEIAKQLVDSCYYTHYSHIDRPKDNATKKAKEQYRTTQISGTTSIVMDVLRVEKELRN